MIVDSYEAVSDENGVADQSLFIDPLHPNTEGYDLLFEATRKAGLEIQ